MSVTLTEEEVEVLMCLAETHIREEKRYLEEATEACLAESKRVSRRWAEVDALERIIEKLNHKE